MEWHRNSTNPLLLFSSNNCYQFISYYDFKQSQFTTCFNFPPNQFNVKFNDKNNSDYTIIETKQNGVRQIGIFSKESTNSNLSTYYLTPVIWISNTNNCKYYELCIEIYTILYNPQNVIGVSSVPILPSCFYPETQIPSGYIQTTVYCILTTPYTPSTCYDTFIWNAHKIIVGLNSGSATASNITADNDSLVLNNIPIINEIFNQYTNILGKDVPILNRCCLNTNNINS